MKNQKKEKKMNTEIHKMFENIRGYYEKLYAKFENIVEIDEISGTQKIKFLHWQGPELLDLTLVFPVPNLPL